MKQKIGILVAAAVFAGTVFAAGNPYTCSMRVGNPKTESKSSDSDSGGKRSSVQKTTMRRRMTWPVKVSFRGKEFPSDVKLQYVCVGNTDGTVAVLDRKSIKVALDEKGDFIIDIASPDAVLVKTKKRTGGRRGRVVSETKGSRIVGCVVQLLVNGEVVRSFASKPTWAKCARKTPLPEDEILRL